MSLDDKVLGVMRGLNQAAEKRGWCLVEGASGVGKTGAIREAIHQLGWDAVWMGVAELEAKAEEGQQGLTEEPRELLVFDGLVDEWTCADLSQLPDGSWTALYSAITVAMARAQQGLLTVVAATCQDGDGDHLIEEKLPGCVVVSMG